MKERQFIYAFLAILMATSLVFTSCKKENPEPSETIPIDENSAFNPTNFVKSFEQLFESDVRSAIDYIHNYENNRIITSEMNYRIFGDFGDDVYIFSHNYNSNGVIVSSVISPNALMQSPEMTLIYVYDLTGYITQLTTEVNGQADEVVHLVYNEAEQLIEKNHEAIGDDYEYQETFVYNSDGAVVQYNHDGIFKTDFIYQNGLMIRSESFYKDVPLEIVEYEYDAEGKLIKTMSNNGHKAEVEYTDVLTTAYYYYDQLNSIQILKPGLNPHKVFQYFYTDENEFMYAMSYQDFDEMGRTNKKEYLEGSPDNLNLIGYSTIESRDPQSGVKTREEVYLADGSLLYYALYTLEGEIITSIDWFDSEDNAIESSDINEEWVFILVQDGSGKSKEKSFNQVDLFSRLMANAGLLSDYEVITTN